MHELFDGILVKSDRFGKNRGRGLLFSDRDDMMELLIGGLVIAIMKLDKMSGVRPVFVRLLFYLCEVSI